MKLAWLIALLAAAFSSLALAALNLDAGAPPSAVNVTVPKPGLTLEKTLVTGKGVELVVRNTAAEPISVNSVSLWVEAPFNLSCTAEAPPLVGQVKSCTYDSARDPAFKPQVIQPGGTVVVRIQLAGLVELLQRSWSGEALVTLRLGDYTLRKRLLFTASLHGEARQAEPLGAHIALRVEGNSTLRVLLRAVLRANASLQGLRGVDFRNFSGSFSVEGGVLKLTGEASPPAQLKLNLTVSAPAGALSGHATPLLLQLRSDELKLGTLLLEPKVVFLKPALSVLPYVYEAEVPGVSSGYLLVAVGPRLYNVTLEDGRGFLALSEAFWPLLQSCEVEPLEVLASEGGAVLAYPAVRAGEGVSLLTGGATIALIAALALVSGVYALLLHRLKARCKPFMEVEV
ncbi:MAG: hypothetical protein QXU91_04440 [Thermofilum sp.]